MNMTLQKNETSYEMPVRSDETLPAAILWDFSFEAVWTPGGKIEAAQKELTKADEARRHGVRRKEGIHAGKV